MTGETDLQSRILLACGALPNVRLFRNTVGEGWAGKVVDQSGAFLTLAHARRITFGWCPGSSDLLGWRSVVITADMVGQQIAQLVTMEVKVPKTGRMDPLQERWLETTHMAGALACVVRSPEEARNLFLT